MERSDILKYFYVVILILFVGGLVVYLYLNLIVADTNFGENKSSKYLDFGSSIGRKKITLSVSGSSGHITIANSIFSICKEAISGFEKNAQIVGLVDINPDFQAILISGSAGVHSENRQYFYLDSKRCPTPIPFVKNSAVAYNIYSDQPSFKSLDYNSDGYRDIGVEYRDYDADPLIDGIREIYLFDSQYKKFIYNRSERYKQ